MAENQDHRPDTAARTHATVERVEVWADGERLPGHFASVHEADTYANALNDDWRSIEVVKIIREVRRVR